MTLSLRLPLARSEAGGSPQDRQGATERFFPGRWESRNVELLPAGDQKAKGPGGKGKK